MAFYQLLLTFFVLAAGIGLILRIVGDLLSIIVLTSLTGVASVALAVAFVTVALLYLVGDVRIKKAGEKSDSSN